MVMLATVAGGAVLTQFGTAEEPPIAGVDYSVEFNTSGGSPTYDLTVQATSMPRADTVYIVYEGSRQQISSIGGEKVISNIQDEDIVYVIAEYKGSQEVVSSYQFDEDKFQRDEF